MKDTESTNAAEVPAVAGRLDLGLGPLLDSWANTRGVQFVSRSYGQYTTSAVSRDSLLDLMRAVQAAELEWLRAAVGTCVASLANAAAGLRRLKGCNRGAVVAPFD